MKTKLSLIMSILFLFCMVPFRINAADDEGTYLVFTVEISEEFPEGTRLSVGSNINTWNPLDEQWIAAQIDETHYSFTVKIDDSFVGTDMEYKWTLQYPDDTGLGWDHVEKVQSAIGAFGNRSYSIKAGKNEINDTAIFNKEVEAITTVTGGTLETVELDMSQFSDGRKRTIRIWLPEGYDDTDTATKYPVLYMNDGQNMFDDATSFVGEWGVDESLQKLFKQGYDKTIVVGIDNGGTERFNELSAEWELNDLGKTCITDAAGSKYADKVGYGVIFSPAFHIYADGELEKFIKENVNSKYQPYLYIYAGEALGSAEKGSVYDESLFTPFVDKVKGMLISNNYSENNIGTKVDVSKSHTEACWKEVFPEAYSWLMDTKIICGMNNNKTQQENKSYTWIIVLSVCVVATAGGFTVIKLRKSKKRK